MSAIINYLLLRIKVRKLCKQEARLNSTRKERKRTGMDFYGGDVDLKAMLEMLKADDDPVMVHQFIVQL